MEFPGRSTNLDIDILYIILSYHIIQWLITVKSAYLMLELEVKSENHYSHLDTFSGNQESLFVPTEWTEISICKEKLGRTPTLSLYLAVFLNPDRAHGVLVRTRRFNSGWFEELQMGDLKRECLEERCSYEEAREVFDHTEATVRLQRNTAICP